MDKMKVGKLLLDLRGETSRKEVSNKIGISVSALQMYENGQRMPKDEIKIEIADYYNKSIEEIFLCETFTFCEHFNEFSGC
ncbi:helix-turn-helix domain-containing protein [Psychrobacillus sp. NPDC093200]|uniref:helix-turn-helix domain-containing protein n=1 Tax=Psychrobacillus sp. NPDC093200 TaxID=3390656 RepID=UPI003D028182